MGTSTDMALGAVAGVLKACVLLWFMVHFNPICGFGNTGNRCGFLQNRVFQKTYLFQLLY